MQLIGEPAAAALLELGTAVTRLVRAHAARARPAGLTLAEIRALGTVEGAPGLILKELAALMGLTPATTSRLAERLVRRGLLTRRAASKDRRRVRFRLTPAGGRALGAARQEIVQVLAGRLSVVTAADARSLAHLTRLIVPALRPDAAR
jgi:DNA-binding MarR family transcriptional regulator